MSPTPAGEVPPSTHGPAPADSSPILGSAPAPPGGSPGGMPGRRPIAVTLAILLMVPSVVIWLIAGIAFFRAMLRADGDGPGRLLVVGIGAAVLALALLVVLLTSLGMMMAWQGDGSAGLVVPAAFTFGIFVVVIVTLLVQDKLTYQPTMVTPLVVGGLAGVALALVMTPPARAWFAGRRR